MGTNRIREWRDRRKLTLEQLADRAGLSASYLQRMESGGRNVSLKNLARLASALDVPQKELVPQSVETVPLVGYVGAGSTTHLFGETQGPFDEVPAPEGSTPATVAVAIRGDSLGSVFDGWLVYYDQIRDPPTDDLVNKLCVVGLSDGRIMVKQIKPGQLPKRFNLISAAEPPIYDAQIDWAAAVKTMSPR